MSERTLFWIDAICIDQNNISERNHQVAFMRYIYARPSLVISWMTPWMDDDHLNMDEDMSKRPYRSLSIDPIEAHIVGNPCWERMWVIQECVLSQTHVVLSGSDWIVPERIPSWTLNNNPHMLSVIKSRMTFHGIQSEKDEQEPTLLQLAMKFRYHQCADARDKIYALLGLKTKPHSIVADYTRSTLGLFVDVAIAAVDFASDHRRMSQVIDLAGALDLDEDLPVVFCLCRLSYHSFMDVPWYNSTSTLAAWTDWLVRTDDGWKLLRRYAEAYGCKTNRPGSSIELPEYDENFDRLDRKARGFLEDLRESHGVDVDTFHKILEDTDAEKEDYSSDSDYNQWVKVVRRARLGESKVS